MHYAILLNRPTKLKTMVTLALGMLLTTLTPSDAATFAQNHPRRAETLRRDARLNQTLNKDFGHLDGHYAQLRGEDRTIRRQEQRYARVNGGHLTKTEQRQINREENHLHNRINRNLAN
jgi:hypothetical protein